MQPILRVAEAPSMINSKPPPPLPKPSRKQSRKRSRKQSCKRSRKQTPDQPLPNTTPDSCGVLTLDEFKEHRSFNDAYCKKTMSWNVISGALIKLILPQIAAELITEKTEPVPTVSIGKDLGELRADILLRVPVRIKPWLFLYILIEQQTNIDNWMAMRICEYLLHAHQAILEQASNKTTGKQTPKRGPRGKGSLPPIEPIVVFTSPDRWTAAKDYETLLDRSIPSLNSAFGCEFKVFELWKVSDEDLEKLGELGVVLLALKYSKRFAMRPQVLDTIFAMLEKYGGDLADLTVTFLLLVCESQFIDVILEHAKRVVFKENPMCKTVADVLEERGEARGLEKGRVEGRVDGKTDTLMRQLTRLFNSVPAAFESLIRKADEQQLNAWLDRLLVSNSIDEVFAEGQA